MTRLDTDKALAWANRATPNLSAHPAAASPVALAGGGGALGSAVLEALLGHGRVESVTVWVSQPMLVVTPRLKTILVGESTHAGFAQQPESPQVAHRPQPSPCEVAVLVMDRARPAHGREQAMWMPQPEDLVPWAQERLNQGASALVVVTPIDPARWPAALREGLATLDEQRITHQAWRQVVWVRPSEKTTQPDSQGWQRVADMVLAQLRFMMPAAHQPVRHSALAGLIALLVAELPTWPAGSRVLSPDTIWQALRADDPTSWMRNWWLALPQALARAELPRM